MTGLSKNTKGKRARPAMNVTPLVDIVLVLLIIFMVVLPNTEAGATVEPPTVIHGEKDPEDADPFVLVLEDDGRMAFGEHGRMSTDRIRGLLESAHVDRPDRKLLLRADRKTKYVHARAVFAMAQDIGFPGVMLRVNANAKETEPTQ